MWDYDKLFAENNVIGLKALHNGKIFVHGVSDECHWGETKITELEFCDDEEFVELVLECVTTANNVPLEPEYL